MATTERLVLCGGTDRTVSSPGGPLHLRLRGPAPNVHCVFEDVGPGLGNVPAPFLDLIDLAAYVYAADQAVSRGGLIDPHFGSDWRRCFRFRVPVRRLDLWSRPETVEALVAALNFLSEDEYHFEFTPWHEPPDNLQFPLDEVLLFSGGLDSFGGAVREAVVEKRHIALIQHRSSPKASQWNETLLTGLRRHAGEAFPFFVPVRINKDEQLTRESTQRTRSFLSTALGTSAAVVLGLPRLRVYENGVVAVNLPLAGQVVGARASRTAHPRGLTLLGRLYSLLAGRPFYIENPFVDLTKTEVLREIAAAGCAELIGLTDSCAHPREASNAEPHCGRCSQCIDRRFAVLAAGLEGFDPATRYKRDLLTGERMDNHPRTMLSAYVAMAQRIATMRPIEFFGRYGEAARVFGHLGGPVEAAADQLYHLYRRHAEEVLRVVEEGVAQHRRAIVARTLPPSCLLRLVCDSRPPGTPTSPPVPATLPANYIARKGKCWEIRFANQSAQTYTPDIGFEYLQLLLERPTVSWSAAELHRVVAQRTRILPSRTAFPNDLSEELRHSEHSNGDERLDVEGRARYQQRLAEIEEALAVLRESHTPDRLERIEELEGERDWLNAELRSAIDRKGASRRLGDERNRVRNRVCTAIRRCLARIKKYDPSLAEHLRKPVLNLGHTISYEPREGTIWSLEAEATKGERPMRHKM